MSTRTIAPRRLSPSIATTMWITAIELDYDRFDQFCQKLPDGVFRAKGTVAIRGLKRRVIFHRVGARNVLDQGALWEDQSRFCRAVFLGQHFDRDLLLGQLHDCAVRPQLAVRSDATSGGKR
jgi:G3E family GTPase